MTPFAIILLGVLSCIAGLLLVWWFYFSGHAKNAAINHFAQIQGWDLTDLHATFGSGSQVALADPAQAWVFKLAYIGSAPHLVRVQWSSQITQSGAVVVAPPLKPALVAKIQKTNDGLGGSIVATTTAQVLKKLGNLPHGVTLDPATLGAAQGILLVSNPPDPLTSLIYNSQAIADLRGQLGDPAALAVILDGHTLSIRAEIATRTPDHLSHIVQAGLALQKTLEATPKDAAPVVQD